MIKRNEHTHTFEYRDDRILEFNWFFLIYFLCHSALQITSLDYHACACVCVRFVVSIQEAISLLHCFSWWFVASGHSRLWLPWWPSEVILDLTLEVSERLWTGHHVPCERLIWFPAVGSLNLLLTTCCFWNNLFIWWFIFKIPTCCKVKGKCSVVKKYNISPKNVARTKIILIVL